MLRKDGYLLSEGNRNEFLITAPMFSCILEKSPAVQSEQF